MTDSCERTLSKNTGILGSKYHMERAARKPKIIEELPKFDKRRLRSLTSRPKATQAGKSRNSTEKLIGSSPVVELLDTGKSDCGENSHDSQNEKGSKPHKFKRDSPVITRRQSLMK